MSSLMRQSILALFVVVLTLVFFSSLIYAEDLTIAFLPRSLGNPIFLDAFEIALKKKPTN